MQEARTFHIENNQLDYLLHLPKSFRQGGSIKWPLLLFLHGAGERGSDLELVKVHGVPNFLDTKEDFPFIVISPQCPEDSYWVNETELLMALIDDITQKYPVDIDRIYLTGLSMGGIGAWHLAIANPSRFAAMAPVCGSLSVPEFRSEELRLSLSVEELFVNLSSLKDLPIWAFHGDEDEIVPLTETKDMIDELRKHGNDARLTVYEGVGHDSWTRAYANQDLYEWFLEKSR